MNAEGIAEIDPVEPARLAESLARWVGVTLMAVLVASAGVLLWRRGAGAIRQPLPVTPLATAAVILATLLAAGRVAWQTAVGRLQGKVAGKIAAWLPVVSGVVVAWALSVPGTATPGLVILWAVLGAEEAVFWAARRWGKRLPRPQQVARRAPAFVEAPPPGPAPEAAGEPIVVGPQPSYVTQQFTRGLTPQGAERMAGWLRVAFAAGQRNATVHVAFCPPFARTPRVAVEQLDGPPARLRVSQRLPYGARIDAKLGTQMDCPLEVTLSFSAEAEPPAADRQTVADGSSAAEAE